MENRVPARLSEINQQIFYHSIVGGEQNDSRNAILQMDKALKNIDKEGFNYHFDEYPTANEVLR